MAHENYTTDELNALKGIFSLYDPDQTGSIPAHELEVGFHKSANAVAQPSQP